MKKTATVVTSAQGGWDELARREAEQRMTGVWTSSPRQPISDAAQVDPRYSGSKHTPPPAASPASHVALRAYVDGTPVELVLPITALLGFVNVGEAAGEPVVNPISGQPTGIRYTIDPATRKN